jgi:Cdc6-like AAA superfamily ATPase
MDSGVRDVFTPHQPVREQELLFGRDREVTRLIAFMNTPGQHGLLFGERGVGKSSLANVAVEAHLAQVVDGNVFRKRCDKNDTFETVLEAPLRAVGFELNLVEVEEGVGRKRGGKLDLKVVGWATGMETARRATYRRTEDVSPSRAAEFIGKSRALLLIDEADALDDTAKQKLAELMKQLSDEGSGFKVLMVGIAETAAGLTAAHPSVSRCLRETKLGRMSDDELEEIVSVGATRVGLTFTSEAVAAIVTCSAGYPHFTHLLALKCAESAIAVGRTKISKDDVVTAMGVAITDTEGSLRASYEDACRSQGTEMYRIVLMAAATLDAAEFPADDLRSAISNITGNPISQGSLNNYLQRLVDYDDSKILRRTAKGVYRFTDPRMPSFVKIANRMA